VFVNSISWIRNAYCQCVLWLFAAKAGQFLNEFRATHLAIEKYGFLRKFRKIGLSGSISRGMSPLTRLKKRHLNYEQWYLVIHNHPKVSGVVLQVVVVDTQIQPACAAHSDRSAIVTDEEIIFRVADAADKRRARAIRHGTAWIIR